MKIINIRQDENISDEKIINKYKDKIPQNEIITQYLKYYKGKIKIILKKIFVFTIFGLSYYFYFLSLESCLDGVGPCSAYIGWIKKKVIQEIISSGLLAIIFQLVVFNKISKYHLIHIIIVFFFLFL